MRYPENTLSLVADVGGTNTRIALASGTEVQHDTIVKYSNTSADQLETLIARYIAEHDGVECLGACVAVAGPVFDGKARLTNRDWYIDREILSKATGATKVAVLNDLQAQGHALGHIAPDMLRPILPGKPAQPHSARLVVGAGTGFNAAPVFETATGRYVPPSESGHADLPLHTEEDLALADFIRERHGVASIEEAVAGRGVATLDAFASHQAGAPRTLEPAEVMAALETGDPIARHAAQLWVHLFGRTLSNLALTLLPYGGIFLIGGVSRAFTPWLDTFGLRESFLDKGRFSTLLEEFPICGVEDDFAALTGCASHLTTL